MQPSMFEDRADKILKAAGIKAKSPAYDILKGTVEELVCELNKMSETEQKKFAISAVEIYKRYTHKAYQEQHKNLEDNEQNHDYIEKPEQFHYSINALLKKIAVYMEENDKQFISLSELNFLFGTKASEAKNLLDKCPLVESKHNNYHFKSAVSKQLKTYFVEQFRNENQNISKP